MRRRRQSEAIHSPRGVRQYSGEVDDAGAPIDGGRLCGCDFVLAEDLPHDIEPARQWCIAKGLFRPSWSFPADRGNERLLRIDELALRLGESGRERSNR